MQIQDQVSPQVIAEIAREVVARLRMQMQQPASAPAAASRDGVFATVDEAASAAFEAQKKVAAMSFDEHDISLAFSGYQEAKVYGDPLYKVALARRLGLIPEYRR